MVSSKTKNANQVGLGRAILNKKAKESRQSRDAQRYIPESDRNARLNSVTQERDLDEFLNTAQLANTDFTAEKQNVRIIHTPTAYSRANQNPFLLSSEEEKVALRKHWELRSKLRVPRRPRWSKDLTPAQLEKQERDAFLDWRRSLADLQENRNLLLTPFERNIEVWRQLWRVIERSHLVVQIVDARNPLRFRCEDLENYVGEVEGETNVKKDGRKSLLLLNKSDLLTIEQRKNWADYFDGRGIQYAFFSAANAKALQEARRDTTVGSGPQRDGTPDEPDQESDEEETKSVDDPSAAEQQETQAEPLPATHEESAEPSNQVLLEHKEDPIHQFHDFDTGTSSEDPRIRVLSVLELETLFVNSAPDLSGFADAEGKPPSKLVVGLVGYPNVGKSSTINSLLGEKKVSVSSTPGKTKHFQTIHLSPTIVLCDCPGLVFPQFATTKAELVCDGVLPIDQMREHTAPVVLVTQRIPREILEGTYGLSIRRRSEEEGGGDEVTAEDLLVAYAIARGFARSGVGNPDEARAARYILKDYVNAKLLYCHPPPDIHPDEFNAPARQQILLRLAESGKKLAPTSRVGKNADTFIALDNPAPLDSLVGEQKPTHSNQSHRSKALDESFFRSDSNLASRPFIQGTSRHGTETSRTTLYPHQNMVANDGSPVTREQAHSITVVNAAGAEGKPGKKHFKSKRTKLRSTNATLGYD